MQGLILAAGMGKRLKNLTANNTKCMIKVNGVTLIERMLSQLDKLNLSKIIIVVGYEGQKLIDFITTLNIQTPILYLENPIYDKTNNIYSLSLAKEYLLEEDTLLLESDLIFEDSVLTCILNDPRKTLALVDKYASWMDGTVIKIDDEDKIQSFIPGKKINFNEVSKYYKTVNIYKFSKSFSENYYVPFLIAYSKAFGNNEYYEQVLRIITMLDEPEIKAKRLDGKLWYEIDDIQDLDIASSIFTPNNDEKVSLIADRYGGYWRYPKLIDFCYLVNPYFPPEKLTDEIKANFSELITSYPSGSNINSLLASRNFNVCPENIVVGNGATELIKLTLERVIGKIGIIRPTFEEYPNRYEKSQIITFTPITLGFSYTADDIISFFNNTDISTLVLINPDNPSGNYIPFPDIIRLTKWAVNKNILIILDESFVDFSDYENDSLINNGAFMDFSNLIVIKSISKSYGVPGLRLGIMVSKDIELISNIKKDIPIWNINSFAEFYMQIVQKYNNEYSSSLEKIKTARNLLISLLNKIDGITVIPSQANYIMLQITNGMTATYLTNKLLINYNIFIKDLSKKIENTAGEFVRIAVKSTEENEQLIYALKEILL